MPLELQRAWNLQRASRVLTCLTGLRPREPARTSSTVGWQERGEDLSNRKLATGYQERGERTGLSSVFCRLSSVVCRLSAVRCPSVSCPSVSCLLSAVVTGQLEILSLEGSIGSQLGRRRVPGSWEDEFLPAGTSWSWLRSNSALFCRDSSARTVLQGLFCNSATLQFFSASLLCCCWQRP